MKASSNKESTSTAITLKNKPVFGRPLIPYFSEDGNVNDQHTLPENVAKLQKDLHVPNGERSFSVREFKDGYFEYKQNSVDEIIQQQAEEDAPQIIDKDAAFFNINRKNQETFAEAGDSPEQRIKSPSKGRPSKPSDHYENYKLMVLNKQPNGNNANNNNSSFLNPIQISQHQNSSSSDDENGDDDNFDDSSLPAPVLPKPSFKNSIPQPSIPLPQDQSLGNEKSFAAAVVGSSKNVKSKLVPQQVLKTKKPSTPSAPVAAAAIDSQQAKKQQQQQKQPQSQQQPQQQQQPPRKILQQASNGNNMTISVPQPRAKKAEEVPQQQQQQAAPTRQKIPTPPPFNEISSSNKPRKLLAPSFFLQSEQEAVESPTSIDSVQEFVLSNQQQQQQAAASVKQQQQAKVKSVEAIEEEQEQAMAMQQHQHALPHGMYAMPPPQMDPYLMMQHSFGMYAAPPPPHFPMGGYVPHHPHHPHHQLPSTPPHQQVAAHGGYPMATSPPPNQSPPQDVYASPASNVMMPPSPQQEFVTPPKKNQSNSSSQPTKVFSEEEILAPYVNPNQARYAGSSIGNSPAPKTLPKPNFK